MVAILEALREDHRNAGRLLDALQHQIDVFAEAGAPDYDIIRGVADYFLDFPDQCHHPKEDAIFSRLEAEHPLAAKTVGDLPREHAVVHERALWFRDNLNALFNDADIARAAVVDAARLFIDAERRHMQREEERFLPVAEQALTAADWRHIAGALAERRDPLFGKRVEKRFKRLGELLLVWKLEYSEGEDVAADATSTR